MTELIVTAAASAPLLAGWSVHALRLTRRIEAARRDPLTGLWTRDAFEDRARKSLSKGQQRAVLVLDLNWFKEINDTHGHAAGDAVIRATGRRLGAWAAGHHGVAGRLGGDEFAAVTDVSGDAGTVTGNLSAKVLDLIRSLERPVPFESRDIDVYVSVGVARYWRGSADLSALPTVHGRRYGRPGTAGKEMA